MNPKRINIISTAEFAEVRDEPETVFQELVIERVILTFLIVALVVSLVHLGKRGVADVADRAKQQSAC
jgi:hypothetical protein